MDSSDGGKGRPSTPPPPTRINRLSQQYLTSPEQPGLNLPFSPGLKRSSLDHQRLPDYKLETPKYYHDDNNSDDKLKKLKTPQYFQTAKNLQFNQDDDIDNLSEISQKLKTKLSSALNNLPEKNSHDSNKFIFSDLTFNQSPTKSSSSSTFPSLWNNNKSLQPANLNLQTLQKSPIINQSINSNLLNPFENNPQPSKISKIPSSRSMPSNLADHRQRIDIPTPKDDHSAHDALLAAISRQQKIRKPTNTFSHKRTSLGDFHKRTPSQDYKPRTSSVDLKINRFSLPPLNVTLNDDKNNEQDAVLSLMSLSSPQAIKFNHSRNSSYNDSPSKPTLPPISGIINQIERDHDQDDNDKDNDDDDATDIDIDVSSDDNG